MASNWNLKVTCMEGKKADFIVYPDEERFVINKTTPPGDAKKLTQEEMDVLINMVQEMNLLKYVKMECDIRP